jgi:hypothetical protein
VGAVIGQTAGVMAGAAVDPALFGAGPTALREGPRLTTLAGLTSTEGAVIPRVYGRVRIGGQIIWATRFEEQVQVKRSGGSGGKGGMGSSSAGTQDKTYSYFANLAVGLCEGPIAFVRRIWADGKELDVTRFVIRVHRGDETQAPDPLIVAKEGADHAPAYRGLAYIVFERMPLADFGNRTPQLSFEVVKPVQGLASMIRAVDLIPGATEYGYSVGALTARAAAGVSASENRHQLFGASDWVASLDALQALCPNLKSVALVVSWFVAVLFAPLLGMAILKAPKLATAGQAPAPGRLLRGYAAFLHMAIRFRWITIAAAVAAFAIALFAVRFVPQQFFPSSDRPELVVDLTLPQNASIHAAEAAMESARIQREGVSDSFMETQQVAGIITPGLAGRSRSPKQYRLCRKP